MILKYATFKSISADTVYHGFMLESLSFGFRWHPNGRLRSRTERHTLASAGEHVQLEYESRRLASWEMVVVGRVGTSEGECPGHPITYVRNAKVSSSVARSHRSSPTGSRHDYAPTRSDSPEDVLRMLQDLRPTHELREKWSYNNLVRRTLSSVVSCNSYQSLDVRRGIALGIYLLRHDLCRLREGTSVQAIEHDVVHVLTVGGRSR